MLNGFKCEHYVLDVGSSMYWDFYISVDYDVVIGIDVMLMQILVKDLRETYIDDAAFELPEGMEVKFAE